MKHILRTAFTFLLLVGIAAGAAFAAAMWPWERRSAPSAGTVLGFRYSGTYEHICKIKLRPDGTSTLEEPILIDPNDRSECLSLRIFDHWERRP